MGQKEIMGCYYLHTNGDLIWKPESVFYNTTPEDYFDSDFVVRFWEIPLKQPVPEDRIGEWFHEWLLEAYKLGANVDRIVSILRTQNLVEVANRFLWYDKEVKVSKILDIIEELRGKKIITIDNSWLIVKAIEDGCGLNKHDEKANINKLKGNT